MSDDSIKRVRSPNYPAVGLPEAISQVQKAFAKINKHAAPRDVIVKALGYGGWNGASAGALSAQLKFGLLDRDGENYRISDRAMQILAPRTATEKASAIRAAGMAPNLFSEFAQEFPGPIPDDELLRSYLIRRGFAPSALASVIRSFRETMDLVERDGGGVESASSQDDKMQTPQNVVVTPPTAAMTISSSAPVISGAAREERIIDDAGGDIVIRFSSEPNYATYEFLADYIALRMKRMKAVKKTEPI